MFELKGRSVVVTGATGFIGSYLVIALIKEGAKVTIVTRAESNVPSMWRSSIDILEFDLSHPNIMLPTDTEYLFHCAGSIRTPEEYESANVVATKNIIDACKKLQSIKRFVHLSSVGVMGCGSPGSFDEAFICSPKNEYEVSKYRAENLVLAAKEELPIAVLRPSTVFGPYPDSKNDPFLILLKAIKSKRFLLIGKEKSYFNLIYIDDVVESLMVIAKANRGVIDSHCYIINDPITWGEFALIVTNKLGIPAVRIVPKIIIQPLAAIGSILSLLRIKFPITMIRYKGLTSKTIFESGAIKRELGFSPVVGVKKGIVNLVENYRNDF